MTSSYKTCCCSLEECRQNGCIQMREEMERENQLKPQPIIPNAPQLYPNYDPTYLNLLNIITELKDEVKKLRGELHDFKLKFENDGK